MKKKAPKAQTEDGDGLSAMTARIPPDLHAFLIDMRKRRGITVQHAVTEALEHHFKEAYAEYLKKRGA